MMIAAEDPDDCDRHPLHYATARGRIEFIKELLSVGKCLKNHI